MKLLTLTLVAVQLTSCASSTTLSWDCSKIPNICSNDYYAIRCQGKPTHLHRDSSDATAHRAANACRSPNRCAGDDAYGSCDEYPYASSAQGGANAVTRCVPAHENSIQGGTLSSFYTRNSIADGDAYSVAFYNTDGLEYVSGSCANQGDEVQRKRQADSIGDLSDGAFFRLRKFNTAEGHVLSMFEAAVRPGSLDEVIGSRAFLSTEQRWTNITAAV